MSRHSKNNTASSIFTYGEKQKLKEYGTLKQRIGQDSQRSFEQCHLCLHRLENPLTCEKGHLFCKDCLVEYMVTEKKRLKHLVERFETRKKGFEDKKTESDLQIKQRFMMNYGKVDQNALKLKTVSDLTESEETIQKIKNQQLNSLLTDKPELIKENFWVSETNRKPDDILGEKPLDMLLCPANRAHEIAFKRTYKVNFHEDIDRRLVCFGCKKELRYQKVLMAKKCGHVFCKSCMEKLCLKENRCMQCNDSIRKEDIIPIIEGFTSFTIHNTVEAERYQPAFVG